LPKIGAERLGEILAGHLTTQAELVNGDFPAFLTARTARIHQHVKHQLSSYV